MHVTGARDEHCYSPHVYRPYTYTRVFVLSVLVMYVHPANEICPVTTRRCRCRCMHRFVIEFAALLTPDIFDVCGEIN